MPLMHKPFPGEIKEARLHPNGWVYRISAKVGDPNGRVPPEAIVGAWKVDEHGMIVGISSPIPPSMQRGGHNRPRFATSASGVI
jgi:hypothetical protein